jgi:hypothetical protein
MLMLPMMQSASIQTNETIGLQLMLMYLSRTTCQDRWMVTFKCWDHLNIDIDASNSGKHRGSVYRTAEIEVHKLGEYFPYLT